MITYIYILRWKCGKGKYFTSLIGDWREKPLCQLQTSPCKNISVLMGVWSSVACASDSGAGKHWGMSVKNKSKVKVSIMTHSPLIVLQALNMSRWCRNPGLKEMDAMESSPLTDIICLFVAIHHAEQSRMLEQFFTRQHESRDTIQRRFREWSSWQRTIWWHLWGQDIHPVLLLLSHPHPFPYAFPWNQFFKPMFCPAYPLLPFSSLMSPLTAAFSTQVRHSRPLANEVKSRQHVRV